MNRHVLVTLFESVVFPDVMQVVPPNNDRSLHFHFDDSASQNAAPNQHIASERALFVNVMSFLCLKNHTAQPFRNLPQLTIFDVTEMYCVRHNSKQSK